MIPILFDSSATEFSTYGIGALSDALSCVAFQEINGEYELVMQYPIDGAFFSQIEQRAIIKAKPDRISEAQPFRIYRITKPLNGIITVYARHLVYDLSGIAVSPFTANGSVAALSALKTNAVNACPFSFSTDINDATVLNVPVPSNIWALMGTAENGLLTLYGGEYEFDGYGVYLRSQRGANRGVSVRYGKNMTSLEQDANCANCWTGVYPYWTDSNNETVVTLPEKIIEASGDFGYTKILALDLSGEFKEAPTTDALKAKATEYMATLSIGVPEVNWKVSFVQLDQSEEYAGAALFESVFLGDTVSVEFSKLGVSATARATKIEYNVLLDRYNSVTLGSVKSNLADTIVSQQKEIQKKPSVSLMQTIVEQLTDSILGANGGSVRLLDTNGDSEPDTLYIADNPDPAKAVKVWRWNYEGWAASSNGYNGPFVFGATLDDGILASAITAANLVAGTIQSADGKTFLLDLDDGIMHIDGEDGSVELVNTPMTLTRSAEYLLNDYGTTAEQREASLARLRNIILEQITPTAADYEKYDFHKDGKLTTGDLVILRNMILYGTNYKITWEVQIDPTNQYEILKIKYRREYGTVDVNDLTILSAGTSGVRLMDTSVAGEFVAEGNQTVKGNVETQGNQTVAGNLDVTGAITVGGKAIGDDPFTTVNVTANTAIPISLVAGERLELIYKHNSIAASGDITLKVNGNTPNGSWYNPATENAVYSGGIIGYAGTTTYATAQITMQVIDDRLIVWGSGIRGNGGLGTFNAMWVTTEVTSITINRAGVLSYKKIPSSGGGTPSATGVSF